MNQLADGGVNGLLGEIGVAANILLQTTILQCAHGVEHIKGAVAESHALGDVVIEIGGLLAGLAIGLYQCILYHEAPPMSLQSYL